MVSLKKAPLLSFLAFLLLLLFMRVTAGAAISAPAASLMEQQVAPSTTTPTLLTTATTQVPTATLTPSATLTATLTLVSTSTPLSTSILADTPTLTPSSEAHNLLELFLSFFPILSKHFPEPTPTPTATETPALPPQDFLVCDNLSRSQVIPDNDPAGVNNTLQISAPGLIVDIDVYLNIDHSWVGDLTARVTHQETGQSALLVDRPGLPGSDTGCANDDIVAILDDGASSPAENRCHLAPPAISGSFKPEEALSRFEGETAAGAWTINVSDLSDTDSGRFYGWCVELTTAGSVPPPAPTPTPTRLPASALVSGVSGVNQRYNLDCEIRSAVDWARFFGFEIGENDFLFNLPTSDNPDAGFVGYYDGVWGHIPPDDYGVHAKPIAALLRDYGVPAYAHRYLRWRDVQAEIAAGRPVIVWTISQAAYGSPAYYHAQDGTFTVVGWYEHTIMIVGYSQTTVWIQDGSKRYTKPLEQFLDSWSVLRNMAILAHP